MPGLACFLDLAKANGSIYRIYGIICESECIDLSITRTYYPPFAERFLEEFKKLARRRKLVLYNSFLTLIAPMRISRVVI